MINKEAPGHATAATLATADAAYTMFVGTAIDRDVSAGRFAWVGGLGEEIAAWAVAGKDVPSQHGQIMDRILRALSAHAGRDSLRTLLRLPAYLGTATSGRLRAERWLATFVAHGHRIEDIAEVVFAEGGTRSIPGNSRHVFSTNWCSPPGAWRNTRPSVPSPVNSSTRATLSRRCH